MMKVKVTMMMMATMIMMVIIILFYCFEIYSPSLF